MATITITRYIYKRNNSTVTPAINKRILRLNFNDSFNNELIAMINKDHDKALLYLRNKANKNSIKLNFYNKSNNKYKKQVYYGRKYLLTIDVDNIKEVIDDFNLFIYLGFSLNDVINSLKKLYI